MEGLDGCFSRIGTSMGYGNMVYGRAMFDYQRGYSLSRSRLQRGQSCISARLVQTKPGLKIISCGRIVTANCQRVAMKRKNWRSVKGRTLRMRDIRSRRWHLCKAKRCDSLDR